MAMNDPISAPAKRAAKERYVPGYVPELSKDLHKRYNPIIKKICTMEKPVIAAINGWALGGGLEYPRLAAVLTERFGRAGELSLAFGLFGAGFTSAITAPLAAAISEYEAPSRGSNSPTSIPTASSRSCSVNCQPF